MGKFKCFTILVGKKKDKGEDESSKSADYQKGLRALQIKIEHPVKPFESDELKSTSFTVSVPFDIQNNSLCNVKVMSHKNPTGVELAEVAYEGEDEHEENTSIKRDLSDLDLQACVANSSEEFDLRNAKFSYFDSIHTEVNVQVENKAEKDGQLGIDMVQSGHVSDPGIGRTDFRASPKLKRSCSNLETGVVLKMIADQLPPSFEELQELSAKMGENIYPGSPGSVTSHCSADKVMLKKHSSSQILPSRSRRLWWKLFLWSHRNLHKPWISKPPSHPTIAALKQQGGYSSDTLEPNQAMKLSNLESPGSFSGESLKKGSTGNYYNDNQSWDGFRNGVSALWPQNQWVAFPGESSSFKRVDEWVKDLEMQIPVSFNQNEIIEEGIVFPPSPETGKSPTRSTAHLTRRSDINTSEDILHANSVIQSLNSSSTVAHIAGIGMKAVPTISHFSSLRSVNLSNNFIVHISAGSLPKGLHTLNLSKNKINTIEGLRELTRLRVLDLSYNRISHLGHGLSNCTLIKELYLAGNKISDIEGLHRLLKLTVLDLSFNKITTTKALGQLVGNYQSLQALNLLGNPIQSNISDDQLRKAVCGLLPKLVYLNKQPIKPQRARELLTDSVAKAVLGNGSRSSKRKAMKRTIRSGSLPSNCQKSTVSGGHKSGSRSKSQNPNRLSSKTLLSSHPPSR
ncbi:hypothetical protein ACOSQ2_010468 [Xanthoceras sorbifolium]|uniref:Uncharacterized protein n=1 Tax=Xanthoceras sorbifolium TaxID=99658 RepID=A0ABQ8HTP3_9ROSI|nr:hypothetical protein JRO89_XS07G0136900 [Xanthoceras sorbifolium]